MTSTIPDTTVAEFLADRSLGLSLLNLGDPIIHRNGLPYKEYYSLTYPGLTKQVHFVNPRPVAGNKDAIITAQMRFQIVPKNIGPGQNISMGVLKTNNPLWIRALDDAREDEIAESGRASILIASEMVEATKSAGQKMADQILANLDGTANALIREHKKQINAQDVEIAKLKAKLREMQASAEVDEITKPSPVPVNVRSAKPPTSKPAPAMPVTTQTFDDIEEDPDVDLEAMAGSALLDETEDEVTADEPIDVDVLKAQLAAEQAKRDKFLKESAPEDNSDDDAMVTEMRNKKAAAKPKRK